MKTNEGDDQRKRPWRLKVGEDQHFGEEGIHDGGSEKSEISIGRNENRGGLE